MMTVTGIVVYLAIGLFIGHWSWRVWDRDIKFSSTEKINDIRCYCYSVNWSPELSLLFPATSRRTHFELTRKGVVPLQFFFSDFLYRKLNPETRPFYVLAMMFLWPLKVAFNLSVMCLWVIGSTLIILLGLMVLAPELTSGKKFGKSYLVKNMPKLRPPQPDDHVEEKRLPVTTTYAQRLAELNAEREKALKRAGELERRIHEVECEMCDSQGGPHRTSPNIPMRSLEIGKRQPT